MERRFLSEPQSGLIYYGIEPKAATPLKINLY